MIGEGYCSLRHVHIAYCLWALINRDISLSVGGVSQLIRIQSSSLCHKKL